MRPPSEIENWNGPLGERWAQFHNLVDARIRRFGADALAAATLRPGWRVLDVGCGCGEFTSAAAEAVGPTGHVVGVDVSKPILAAGRLATQHLANVELLEQDAATYRPSPPFDALISRFGVMFFENPAAAFANLRSATKTGGRLAFVCWQKLEANPWAKLPLDVVLPLVPKMAPPDPHAPGPFAFGAEARIRDVLARGGWSHVELTRAAHPMVLGDSLDEAVDYVCRFGPASRALRDVDDPTRESARLALQTALAPHGPSFALPGAVWIVTGRA